MLTLFLGPDDFSKKEYVDALAAKEKAEVVVFSSPEALPMGQLAGQDLFAAKKIFIVQNGLKLLDEKIMQGLVGAKNQVFLFEEKLDKRSKFNKDLAANKSIPNREFPLPHGKDLDRWIGKRVTELGGSIEPAAAESLAIALGRDEARETKFGGKVVEVEELFTLWQADSEIKKLLAYAAGMPIQAFMVGELVVRVTDSNALDIVNAIGEKNKLKALALIGKFLEMENAGDEKGKIIQLNALLSEQFRTIAMVQDFLRQGAGESDMVNRTGWKSGRVFVIKKLAAHFEPKKVLETLGKLYALDEELKSSSTPPQVLLDLIVVQLFPVTIHKTEKVIKFPTVM